MGISIQSVKAEALREARARLIRKGFTMAAEELETFDPLMVLTPREIQVIKGVAAGLVGRQLAKRLKVAPQTISVHRVNIAHKIGLHERVDIAQWAIRHGLAVNKFGPCCSVQLESVIIDPKGVCEAWKCQA